MKRSDEDIQREIDELIAKREKTHGAVRAKISARISRLRCIDRVRESDEKRRRAKGAEPKVKKLKTKEVKKKPSEESVIHIAGGSELQKELMWIKVESKIKRDYKPEIIKCSKCKKEIKGKFYTTIDDCLYGKVYCRDCRREGMIEVE